MPRPKKSETETVKKPTMDTKTFPITLLSVSQEWIHNLYLEMKRTVMAKAIDTDCPKEFLDHLNGLELKFSEKAQISLEYRKMVEEEEVVDTTVIQEAVKEAVEKAFINHNPASQPAVEASPQEVSVGSAVETTVAVPVNEETAEEAPVEEVPSAELSGEESPPEQTAAEEEVAAEQPPA